MPFREGLGHAVLLPSTKMQAMYSRANLLLATDMNFSMCASLHSV